MGSDHRCNSGRQGDLQSVEEMKEAKRTHQRRKEINGTTRERIQGENSEGSTYQQKIVSGAKSETEQNWKELKTTKDKTKSDVIQQNAQLVQSNVPIQQKQKWKYSEHGQNTMIRRKYQNASIPTNIGSELVGVKHYKKYRMRHGHSQRNQVYVQQAMTIIHHPRVEQSPNTQPVPNQMSPQEKLNGLNDGAQTLSKDYYEKRLQEQQFEKIQPDKPITPLGHNPEAMVRNPGAFNNPTRPSSGGTQPISFSNPTEQDTTKTSKNYLERNTGDQLSTGSQSTTRQEQIQLETNPETNTFAGQRPEIDTQPSVPLSTEQLQPQIKSNEPETRQQTQNNIKSDMTQSTDQNLKIEATNPAMVQQSEQQSQTNAGQSSPQVLADHAQKDALTRQNSNSDEKAFLAQSYSTSQIAGQLQNQSGHETMIQSTGHETVRQTEKRSDMVPTTFDKSETYQGKTVVRPENAQLSREDTIYWRNQTKEITITQEHGIIRHTRLHQVDKISGQGQEVSSAKLVTTKNDVNEYVIGKGKEITSTPTPETKLAGIPQNQNMSQMSQTQEFSIQTIVKKNVVTNSGERNQYVEPSQRGPAIPQGRGFSRLQKFKPQSMPDYSSSTSTPTPHVLNSDDSQTEIPVFDAYDDNINQAEKAKSEAVNNMHRVTDSNPDALKSQDSKSSNTPTRLGLGTTLLPIVTTTEIPELGTTSITKLKTTQMPEETFSGLIIASTPPLQTTAIYGLTPRMEDNSNAGNF